MEDELDVKAIREHLGLTQAQLAEAVGVDQSTVSNWERGAAPRGPARKLLQGLRTKRPEPDGGDDGSTAQAVEPAHGEAA